VIFTTSDIMSSFRWRFAKTGELMINSSNEIEISVRIKKYDEKKVFAVTFLIVLLIGLTDYISGYEMSFSIFYLIPISIAVIYSNRKTALIISVISAALWLLVDLSSGNEYSNMLAPFWNGTMRLGYFSLHTVISSKALELFQETKNMSLIDPLTNIANWRFFQETLKRELDKSRRTGFPLTLVYIDLDNFKKMNDTFGHNAGDDLLKLIATKITAPIRTTDLLARLGGDEFALLLPETDHKSAKLIVDRIHSELSEVFSRKNYPVTLSMGVVVYKKFDLSIKEMVGKADNLMYQVKENGKNSVLYENYPDEEEPTS